MSENLVGGKGDAASIELRSEALGPEKRRRAALTVCAHSASAAEARELLLMLGLVDEGTAAEPEPEAAAPAATDDGAPAGAEVRRLEPKPERPARDGVHGHPIGLAQHVARDEELCPPCAALWRELEAAGVVQAVSP